MEEHMRSFVVVSRPDGAGENHFLRDEGSDSWTDKRAYACRFFDEEKVKRLVESYAGKRNRKTMFYEPYEQTTLTVA
jgi:hypothetical protein